MPKPKVEGYFKKLDINDDGDAICNRSINS